MKNARQKKILEIIAANDIDTQEALITKLKEEGYPATQTTVSRDINQLKLVKTVTASGTYKYTVSGVHKENIRPAMSSSLNDAVLKIEAAKNIVVVKTLPGMANAVAVCIDSFNHSEIVGSVAGDDTVIIVTFEDAIAKKMQENLKNAFKFNG